MKIFTYAFGLVAAVGLAQGQAAQWQDVVRNLRHPDARTRLEAVELLGNAGYTAAAEAVAPLITDSDNRVQYAAIDAELTFFLIEPIGGRRILSFTGSTRSRAQEAFDAGPLVRAYPAAPAIVLDNLIAAMRDENPRIRFDAVHAIGVIGEAPLTAAQVKALADGLDHYEPVIRAATARVLGRLRATEAGDKLVASLNDSSDLVQRFATEALGLMRHDRAFVSLLARFNHFGKGDMAAETLLAIARIMHPSARDLFTARLADRDPDIRRAAVEGLGRLKDKDSIDTFQRLSKTDSSESVRVAALFASSLQGEQTSHLLAAALASQTTGAQARDYLLELGRPAVPGVQSALGVTTNAEARSVLIHLIGYIGKTDDIPIVEPFLKDRNEQVARAATNAVARIRDWQSRSRSGA